MNLDNSKDPLLAGPDAERHLFIKLVQQSDGYDLNVVAGAAVNLLVNCLRHAYPQRDDAVRSAEQLSAKIKELVDKNYLPTGNRASVFAHDQVIEAPRMDFRATFFR